MIGTHLTVLEVVGEGGSADGAVLIAKCGADVVAVDDVVATPDHGLSVRERRPGEIDARPPAILVCRENIPVRVRRSAEINQSALVRDLRILGTRVEVSNRIIPLPEPAEQVVPQPDIQREISCDSKVVLNIEAPVIIALVRGMVGSSPAVLIYSAQ